MAVEDFYFTSEYKIGFVQKLEKFRLMVSDAYKDGFLVFMKLEETDLFA